MSSTIWCQLVPCLIIGPNAQFYEFVKPSLTPSHGKTMPICRQTLKSVWSGCQRLWSANFLWICSVCFHFSLVDFTDPYNHTYSESLWWKLFKNHKRTQKQRQRQWQRQIQRQRQSAWKTQHILYFWNPDDLLIWNMMIDTSGKA